MVLYLLRAYYIIIYFFIVYTYGPVLKDVKNMNRFLVYRNLRIGIVFSDDHGTPRGLKAVMVYRLGTNVYNTNCNNRIFTVQNARKFLNEIHSSISSYNFIATVN